MDKLVQIQMLHERLLVIDMFLETYNNRIKDLSIQREQYMKEIVELRLTPIMEA
jgi:hypothetical protein